MGETYLERRQPRKKPRIAALLGFCSTARGGPSDVDSPEVKARRRQGVVFPYPVTYAQSGADLTTIFSQWAQTMHSAPIIFWNKTPFASRKINTEGVIL